MIIGKDVNNSFVLGGQDQLKRHLTQSHINTMPQQSREISRVINVTGAGEVAIANIFEKRQLEEDINVLKKEIINQLKLAKSLVSPEVLDSFVREFPEKDQPLAQNILKLAFPFSNNAGISLITEMLTSLRDPLDDNKLQIVETEPLKHNSIASVLYYLVINKSSGYYVDSSGSEVRIPQQETKKYFANSGNHEIDSNSAFILNQDLIGKLKKDPNLLKQIVESNAKLIIFEGLTNSSNPYSFSFDAVKKEVRSLLQEIKARFDDNVLLKPDELLKAISQIRSEELLKQLSLVMGALGDSKIADENILNIQLPKLSKQQLLLEETTAYDNFSKEKVVITEENFDAEFIKLQSLISGVLKDSGFNVDSPFMNKNEVKDFIKIYKDILVTVNQRDLAEILFQAVQQVMANLPEGYSKENILFFVPKDASKQYKSLSLLNLILKEQYGFSDEQFVTVENLQNDYSAKELEDKTFVILDDFAGSGNSIFYFAQELLVGRKLPKDEQDEYRAKMKDKTNLILVNLFATNYARQNTSSRAMLPHNTVYICGDKHIESIYENETFIKNRSNDPVKYDLKFGSHGFTKGKPGDGNGCAVVFFYMGPNNSVQAFANLNSLFTSTATTSIKNLSASPESIADEANSVALTIQQSIAEKIITVGNLVLAAKMRDQMRKIPPPIQEKIESS